MVFPFSNIELTGSANGEFAPVAMLSSQGKLTPSALRWLRKSATVLSEGTRVSLKVSGIPNLRFAAGRFQVQDGRKPRSAAWTQLKNVRYFSERASRRSS